MTHVTARDDALATDEMTRLIGLPFNDSDDVIRAAVAEASVPSLLM